MEAIQLTGEQLDLVEQALTKMKLKAIANANSILQGVKERETGVLQDYAHELPEIYPRLEEAQALVIEISETIESIWAQAYPE